MLPRAGWLTLPWKTSCCLSATFSFLFISRKWRKLWKKRFDFLLFFLRRKRWYLGKGFQGSRCELPPTGSPRGLSPWHLGWRMFQSRHFKLATCSVISYHNLISRRFLRKLARCVTLESGECDKRARRILRLCALSPCQSVARENPWAWRDHCTLCPSGLPLHHVRACLWAASVCIWRPEKYADPNLWWRPNPLLCSHPHETGVNGQMEAFFFFSPSPLQPLTHTKGERCWAGSEGFGHWTHKALWVYFLGGWTVWPLILEYFFFFLFLFWWLAFLMWSNSQRLFSLTVA